MFRGCTGALPADAEPDRRAGGAAGVRRHQTATLIRPAEQDNVAVATRNLERGAVVTVEGEELTTRDAIPFAHKVAIRAIEQDGQVFKYGVPIGRAKVAIEPGQHVHVHNIKSDYVNNEVDFFEDAAIEDTAKGAAS
jgi:(2R)-sulfolactate sulfo-lyase subunit alpha